MHNSIWDYYGLQKHDRRILATYEYEYTDLIEKNRELIELGKTLDEQAIVLCISIKAETILDRKREPHILIKQRLGLFCDTLLEHQINTFEGLVRICAVKVHHGQFQTLLKTLFNWSSYSFAIILHENNPPYILARLLNLFEDGLLTLSAIKACSNTALSEGMSFLHVIRGNDGYSVNMFSKQQ